jgi:hypothetical protein
MVLLSQTASVHHLSLPEARAFDPGLYVFVDEGSHYQLHVT